MEKKLNNRNEEPVHGRQYLALCSNATWREFKLTNIDGDILVGFQQVVWFDNIGFVNNPEGIITDHVLDWVDIEPVLKLFASEKGTLSEEFDQDFWSRFMDQYNITV
ncbi:MAG: hypothetical protein PHT07_14810 [Paludibacter sp.]|nr:hypothetical protein [Paludibacter sp.]